MNVGVVVIKRCSLPGTAARLAADWAGVDCGMIEQLIAAGREMVVAGMVKGWGGNLSGRVRDRIAITRSGADLGQLTTEEFVLVRPDANAKRLRSRQPRPSSEVAMHLSAYAARPETQVVIHVHPPKSD